MSMRSETGWQTEKTVLECNGYMLENEIATDVCFEVGLPDGATNNIRAHKYMLISRSPVFEAMFSSGMIECRNGVEAKIRIEDIKPEIFKELLRFIYCENSTVCCKTASALMYAAKKYMLPKLVQRCGDCLRKDLDVRNVIIVLEHSLLFDDKELTSECLKLIALNSDKVLKGAEIMSASRPAMEAILSLDTMESRELDIFNMCVSWAKSQLETLNSAENPTDEQLREMLGGLLYKIRFPAMEPSEFAKLSRRKYVLTSDEKESIYYYFVTKEKDSELMFSTERRWGEEVWIDRTVTCTQGNWRYSAPTVDAIDFKTNCDILLTGVGLYPGNKAVGYETDFEILQSTTSLFRKRVSIPCTGNANPFKVCLDQPIAVRAGAVYTIKSFAHDYIGYYGNPCKAVCENGKVTITFLSYTNTETSKTSTTETYGQIPRLYFCQF